MLSKSCHFSTERTSLPADEVLGLAIIGNSRAYVDTVDVTQMIENRFDAEWRDRTSIGERRW